jgi:hypothetical protein
MRGPCRRLSSAAAANSSAITYRPRSRSPTNIAFGLIDLPDLATYERYRAMLMSDVDAVESLRRAEAAGCVLNEDTSFVRRVPS